MRSTQDQFAKICFVICLLIVLTAFSGCSHLSPGLDIQVHPAAGESISAYGWVGVSFPQPMDKKSTELALTISPYHDGEYIWKGNTLWIRPLSAFDPSIEYHASLSGDLVTEQGQTIPIDQSWTFSIREPALIYYVPGDTFGEIWRAEPDGSNARQLSQTGDNLVEYAPSRTGEWVAFTVENDENGRDLWIMDREGEKQSLKVNCSQDVCGEPAWSMDEAQIAYTRSAYLPATGGYQPARVYTVDFSNGETSPLYQDDTVFSQSPSFSPDGNKMATYDSRQEAIRIVDLETHQESIIPRTLEGTGDWSPSGDQILFTDLMPAFHEPFVEIFLLDTQNNEVNPLFEETIGDTEFSQPRWSPGGNWLAVSLRAVNSNISKALWVLSLDGKDSHLVADDQSATYSNYRWDPRGQRLVFQRLSLGSSDLKISIWIWDWDRRMAKKIIEQGLRPEWLP